MIYGYDDDWNVTEIGHFTIYSMEPEQVCFNKHAAARTIYELRLDVARLNDEVIALHRISDVEWDQLPASERDRLDPGGVT